MKLRATNIPDAVDAVPVVGDDLVLIHDASGNMHLYDTQARSIGAFSDARDAWAAIDAIDLAERDWFAQAA